MWKASSLITKGMSCYCICMYGIHLFQISFYSILCTYFSFTLPNDIFPYSTHPAVPQTHWELSNSQGKHWVEVWWSLTNRQLITLFGHMHWSPQTQFVRLAWYYLSMNFLCRNSQSRQQHMQVLPKRQHVTSHAQWQNTAPLPAIMPTRGKSQPI